MSWAASIRDELRKCTNCGLCLSACPTFAMRRAEGDSPRGRVRLTGELLAGRGDSVAVDHVGGCIECAACHPPCPTGLRFATVRRLHRMASQPLDRISFTRRVDELRDAIGRDQGAALTVRAIRAMLAEASRSADPSGPLEDGVLLLSGAMVKAAEPSLAARLEARAVPGARRVHDPQLCSALDRASGLLSDVGLVAEHEDALAEVNALVSRRGYRRLTVCVVDCLSFRLCDEPLPADLRIVAAPGLLPLATTSLPPTVVWDGPPASPFLVPELSDRCLPLPAEHQAANGPVLLDRTALASLRAVAEARHAWVGGRPLLTPDVRTVVRSPGARHLADLVCAVAEAEAT